MVAIKDQTTTISVDKTLAEITRLLGAHGARRITIDYDGKGNPSALAFSIDTPLGERAFLLPANVDGVWRALTKGYEEGRVQRRFASREQAARTAFRILKDWLEAQVAIIDAGMASMDEALFAYLLAPTGRTAYVEYTEQRLLLPEAR